LCAKIAAWGGSACSGESSSIEPVLDVFALSRCVAQLALGVASAANVAALPLNTQ
jgi:hypothetical protein